MTFGPSPRLTASAIEIHDDDGDIVATIYCRGSSIEIVTAAGVALDYTVDLADRGQRLSVAIARELARRR